MRVSHSQGPTRRHQFQPGIITEPPAVSQSFHRTLLQPTRPHSTKCLPNLTAQTRLDRKEQKWAVIS